MFRFKTRFLTGASQSPSFSLREKVAAGRMRVLGFRIRPKRPSSAAPRHLLPGGEGFVSDFAVLLRSLTWILTLAALAPLPFTSAQAPPAESKRKAENNAKPATVPFEMLASNHMVVNAKLNGKGPFRLIFDLGAPITLLSNRASEASGVVKKNAPRSMLFAMRGEAKAQTLDVGELHAKDIPVIVLDHPALTALGGFLGKPLDGIIGFTFFARYKTTIDYQAKTMTFEPVDFEVRNLMKDLPERLAGPKVAKRQVLAPGALFGLLVGHPVGGLTSSGVPIKEVSPGSPAEAAGLKTGDVLTGLDGRWTTTISDVFAAASWASPGKAMDVTVLRDGKPLSLKVTPREGL